jgi:hypothetical protein
MGSAFCRAGLDAFVTNQIRPTQLTNCRLGEKNRGLKKPS